MPIYRLIYDYFYLGMIDPMVQKDRMINYFIKNEPTKEYISKLIFIRISEEFDSYYSFYNRVKTIPVSEFVLRGVETEIKIGFFSKELYFNGEKYESFDY